MRAIVAGILTGLALVGCGTPQTSGIVAIGPDTYAVETRGRQLAPAVERGLTEATSFCTAQSRQTELLGTRINADSYQVAFRCTGGTGGTGLAGNPGIMGRMPAGFTTRNSSMGPIPVASARPVISGQAFQPAPAPPVGFDLGTVGQMPGRSAVVSGNPFGQAAAPPPRLPTALPSLSSLSAPAAPLQAPLQPLGGAMAPVASSPFAPLQSPLAAPGASMAPAAMPAVAPGFAPLASPFAAAPAAASSGSAALPPLATSAAPAGFQPLASPFAAAPSGSAAFAPLAAPAAPAGFQPLPGAARPLAALPPVAGAQRGGTGVPSVAPGAPLGDSSGVVPPPAFWNTPR